MPEIIQTKFITRHHNNPLVVHFDINKTRELISYKYYWSSFKKDIKAYVKDCNVYLASKVIRHKLYGDLQALPILIHQ